MSRGIEEIANLANQIISKNWSDKEKDMVFWDIITALRGPDSDNWLLKERTTERLRKTVCPHLSEANGALITDGLLEEVEWRREESHFIDHYNKAVVALNKLWREK